jgi:hypothetical protein
MSKSSKLSTAIKAFNVSECVMCGGDIQTDWLLPEDLNYWAGLEVVTVDGLEEIINFRHSFSDYHKDVHGTRPRWKTDHYTLSDWRTTFESLSRQSEQNQIEDQERERIAIEDFKKLLAKTARQGAGDFKTAMRWLMDADDINPRYPQAVESFFYDHGILFTEYGRKLSKLKY